VTDFRTEGSIGERIQAARKSRGIRTARELAELINSGSVTESIIQNIEAGRKEDLSVSQLLNIAFALKVPPGYLLAPLGHPLQNVDLVGISAGLVAMTTVEFDAWLSGAPSGAYKWTSNDERAERGQLQALRDLEHNLQERSRLQALVNAERASAATAADIEEQQRWDTNEERLDNAQRQINQLTGYLESAGFKLDGWVR
jgi:transcriptional regulator with XRE-family HTH domain